MRPGFRISVAIFREKIKDDDLPFKKVIINLFILFVLLFSLPFSFFLVRASETNRGKYQGTVKE
jgi:hypothetical protein